MIDNFFEDPMDVRKFALLQQFDTDKDFSWPGKRTESLFALNKNLFDYVIKKTLRVFYNEQEPYHYEASMFFQLVDQSYNSGWVHSDLDALITGIIYLNPEESNNSGTSLYRPLSTGIEPFNLDIKKKFFMREIDNCDKERNDNNSMFEETINIKNKFNRLVLFDSHLYHSANDFKNEDSNFTRLTLVFFIKKLFVHQYPIQRMRRFV